VNFVINRGDVADVNKLSGVIGFWSGLESGDMVNFLISQGDVA